ncbi:hypothetical protein [Streptomyces sp. H27-H5]|uniref:hypothetical protein n=1 Tax=Streptomyces sp. H27-H5 TaxID=2996460 RepID=UPI00226E67E6|nr:hypothetical protein [Streptomyces sp. H27-H5]MCY0960811.1 hypothetical protein [Streptomyces sp. H27-H5]
MPADPTRSTNPPLSFRLDGMWLKAFLRVDRIRHDTLVSLVSGWSDTEVRKDVTARLVALAEVMSSIRREGELDAAVEAVEDEASMHDAEIEIDLVDALRLRDELNVVIEKLARFNPAAARPDMLAKMPHQRRAS